MIEIQNKATPTESIVCRTLPAPPRFYRSIWPLFLLFIQIYERYSFMYDIIDREFVRMGMDFTNLLVAWQRQIASYVDMCAYRWAYSEIHNNE